MEKSARSAPEQKQTGVGKDAGSSEGTSDRRDAVKEVPIDDGGYSYLRFSTREQDGVELARYTNGNLRIFPAKGSDFDSSEAHGQILEIRLEGHEKPFLYEHPEHGFLLDGLPDGLGSVFRYGMNLPRKYKCITNAIELGTECTVLSLTHDEKTSVEGKQFRLPYEKFNEFVQEIDRLHNRGHSVVYRIKNVTARNLVSSATSDPHIEPGRGRLPIIQKMTDAILGNNTLEDSEVEDVINLLTDQVASVARRRTESVGQLREDLNLVTLEVLIERFSKSLNDKKRSRDESFWQSFFTDNQFALQQLFGFPVVKVSDKQLQVKPPRSDGSGAREVDFLLLNTLTKEGLIVEIKTPSATLMKDRSYRGTGSSDVFPPHQDLVKAVAQLQSQMESLQEQVTKKLADDDPLSRVHHASPRGALIVGQVSTLDAVSLESFRRYRDGLHNVTVLGFDEVAERLRALQQMLSNSTEV